MVTIEETRKAYNKYLKEFFLKNFAGKPPEIAIAETVERAIINLTKVFTNFMYIRDCCSAIKKDKLYFNKMTPENQKNLRITIVGLWAICREIDKILKPFAETNCSETVIPEYKD